MKEIANASAAIKEIVSAPIPSREPPAPVLASASCEPRRYPVLEGLRFPRTSMSVMLVLDENGALTQLCTAGDLLRWCKAAWRAEEI